MDIQWKRVIHDLVKERDFRESRQFQQFIENYNLLLDENVKLKKQSQIKHSPSNSSFSDNSPSSNILIQELQKRLVDLMRESAEKSVQMLQVTNQIQEYEKSIEDNGLQIQELRKNEQELQKKFAMLQKENDSLLVEVQRRDEELINMDQQIQIEKERLEQMIQAKMNLQVYYEDKIKAMILQHRKVLSQLENSPKSPIIQNGFSFWKQIFSSTQSLINSNTNSPVSSNTILLPNSPTSNQFDGTSAILKFDKSHSSSIHSIQFNGNNSLVLTSGSDQMIKLWSLVEDQESHQLKLQLVQSIRNQHSISNKTQNSTPFIVNSPPCLTRSYLFPYNYEQHILACDRILKLFHKDNGKLVLEFIGHEAKVNAAAFVVENPSNTNATDPAILQVSWSRIITGSNDMTVKLWDIQQGYSSASCIKTFLCASTCTDLLFQSSLGAIISSHFNQTIQLHDIKSLSRIQTISSKHTQPITSIDMVPHSNYIVTTARDHSVQVIDVRMHKHLHTLYTENNTFLNRDSMTKVKVSHCGTMAAVGSSFMNGSICLFKNIQSGTQFSSTILENLQNKTSDSMEEIIREETITCIDWGNRDTLLACADTQGRIFLVVANE